MDTQIDIIHSIAITFLTPSVHIIDTTYNDNVHSFTESETGWLGNSLSQGPN